MFQGSIPPEMRSIVAETAGGWPGEVWVGCSGNFTIERCLPGRVRHSNDVTLYSSTLGWWASGLERLPLSLKQNSPLSWLKQNVEAATATEQLATVLLMTRFAASAAKPGHPYHQRMVDAHRDQWPVLMEKTMTTLNRNALRLASFHSKDVVDWVRDDVPGDAPLLMFPPFWSGGYEAMWKGLTDNVDWPEPDYQVMDTDAAEALLARVMDREHWLLGLLHRRPEWDEKWLRGMVQTSPRNLPIWVYGSSDVRRVAQAQIRGEKVLFPRLSPDDVLQPDDEVKLHPLNPAQFNALRSQYLDVKIAPSAGGAIAPLALSANGRLFGVLAFLDSQNHRDPEAFILSDFGVRPTAYKRISRLVVACSQSTEVQAYVQRCLNHEVLWLTTAAFSNNPAAMKYRWTMKCVKRTRTPDAAHKYELLYHGIAGRWTLQEALGRWLQTQSERVDSDG